MARWLCRGQRTRRTTRSVHTALAKRGCFFSADGNWPTLTARFDREKHRDGIHPRIADLTARWQSDDTGEFTTLVVRGRQKVFRHPDERPGWEMQSPPVRRILSDRSPCRDDHSSRRALARALEPPTRSLAEQGRRLPIWCCCA